MPCRGWRLGKERPREGPPPEKPYAKSSAAHQSAYGGGSQYRSPAEAGSPKPPSHRRTTSGGHDAAIIARAAADVQSPVERNSFRSFPQSETAAGKSRCGKSAGVDKNQVASRHPSHRKQLLPKALLILICDCRKNARSAAFGGKGCVAISLGGRRQSVLLARSQHATSPTPRIEFDFIELPKNNYFDRRLPFWRLLAYY
jgi:hypothetical protein